MVPPESRYRDRFFGPGTEAATRLLAAASAFVPGFLRIQGRPEDRRPRDLPQVALFPEIASGQNPTAFLFPSLVMSTVFVQASIPVRRFVRVRRKV
jgi:hypothetical protein